MTKVMVETTMNHAFLLKCITGLVMASIGALILASIIAPPVAPVIIGAARITDEMTDSPEVVLSSA